MPEHGPECIRLQYWDAGEEDAACVCGVCNWCGEWLDETRSVLTEFGNMHPECVEDAREHYNGDVQRLEAHE